MWLKHPDGSKTSRRAAGLLRDATLFERAILPWPLSKNPRIKPLKPCRAYQTFPAPLGEIAGFTSVCTKSQFLREAVIDQAEIDRPALLTVERLGAYTARLRFCECSLSGGVGWLESGISHW
jgi:hypothetical protein